MAKERGGELSFAEMREKSEGGREDVGLDRLGLG
jgi:hypothetical protein